MAEVAHLDFMRPLSAGVETEEVDGATPFGCLRSGPAGEVAGAGEVDGTAHFDCERPGGEGGDEPGEVAGEETGEEGEDTGDVDGAAHLDCERPPPEDTGTGEGEGEVDGAAHFDCVKEGGEGEDTGDFDGAAHFDSERPGEDAGEEGEGAGSGSGSFNSICFPSPRGAGTSTPIDSSTPTMLSPASMRNLISNFFMHCRRCSKLFLLLFSRRWILAEWSSTGLTLSACHRSACLKRSTWFLKVFASSSRLISFVSVA